MQSRRVRGTDRSLNVDNYRRQVAELHLDAARRAARPFWEIKSWQEKVKGWRKLQAWHAYQEKYHELRRHKVLGKHGLQRSKAHAR